ncbi:hypothetical protein RCO22_12595 [Pseudomonas yamanorum]|uniref:Restriction endonuclease n=1 Tax=Pseudomonas yamanorum TaxID=515393 RepID=A0ABU1CR82_9PSED|nr:hypothetical protein [Pseudomonas yamanorum]MDR0189780.1 hypothetical protein [Pseudomonas yamanorum]
MKRLPRKPLKFDPIELFTAIARDSDYKIEAAGDHADFLARVGDSLKAAADDQRLLHGKRIESLFAHVAGALGQCAMVKQEDSGAIFAAGKNIQAPDYSIVLKDGSRYMIEVKNCHHGDFKDNYILKRDYVERLENYAALQGTTIKFAIYFSRINKWTLLSTSSLTPHNSKYTINIIEAIAKNEMITLGDRMIGTKPDLSIELIASKEKDSFITQNGQASFTVGDVKLYSEGNEIQDHKEKSIAYYLVRFGNWVTDTPNAIMDGNRVISVRYDFCPYGEWDEEAGFAIVGDFSSMVSSAYHEQTVYEQKVIALDSKNDPDLFSVDIEDGYSGKNLPLWQLAINPNLDFKVS